MMKWIYTMFNLSPLLKIVNGSLVELPCPSNINSMWNFGSLLSLCLGIQIVTGLFLSMHYCSSSSMAFFSVSHIMRDVNMGWLIRILHANGASFFFASLYLHIARGMYFNSFTYHAVWMIGVSIFLATMATAFLGYVLPWGQMSFWGATVITNLFSAIPILGNEIVLWLWGGFAVGEPTLSRFFALHFILPMAIAMMVIIHLMFLHTTGSNNPLGMNSNYDKIMFHSYFSLKDLLGFVTLFWLLFWITLSMPWLLGDSENFINANPLLTPIHIQPEWYFLFAYAILRSIPNKLGGVVALLLSVVVLYFLPLITTNTKMSSSVSPLKKFTWWWFVILVFLLTWIGARPVEQPFLNLGQNLTALYFTYFIFLLY